jgi:tRNA-Thr(GGU) m(6)t(6)A37 methyltransferase TsaA
MARLGSILLEPIGFVRTKASLENLKHQASRSEIVIKKRFGKGLLGISGFSHVFVLYWMHKMSEPERKILRIHPRHRLYLPKQGIFATRSHFRPNPIGLSVVKLLRRRSNVLIVKGLDAFDGTPVLDIKPYDHWDRLNKVRVPGWWKRLEKEERTRLG